MGRKRKQPRNIGDDTENTRRGEGEYDLNVTTSSTDSTNKFTISAVAESLNTVISLVTENGKKLDSLENRIKGIEDKVANLEISHVGFARQLAENDERVRQLEQVKESLKNQVKIISDDCIAQSKESNNLSMRLARLEFDKLEKNIIVWNVSCESEKNAKDIFKSILTEGLEMAPVPPFKVTQVSEQQKFIRVEVSDKKSKIDILKNAKKLKGKAVSSFRDIYLSDDVPAEVRKARNDLLIKRAKLRKLGIDAWISKTFPPVLLFNRPNGTRAKYSPDDLIPELDYAPNNQSFRNQYSGN
jgi:archaellum component FlaC